MFFIISFHYNLEKKKNKQEIVGVFEILVYVHEKFWLIT